jgi:hypothetical protein
MTRLCRLTRTLLGFATNQQHRRLLQYYVKVMFGVKNYAIITLFDLLSALSGRKSQMPRDMLCSLRSIASVNGGSRGVSCSIRLWEREAYVLEGLRTSPNGEVRESKHAVEPGANNTGPCGRSHGRQLRTAICSLSTTTCLTRTSSSNSYNFQGRRCASARSAISLIYWAGPRMLSRNKSATQHGRSSASKLIPSISHSPRGAIAAINATRPCHVSLENGSSMAATPYVYRAPANISAAISSSLLTSTVAACSGVDLAPDTTYRALEYHMNRSALGLPVRHVRATPWTRHSASTWESRTCATCYPTGFGIGKEISACRINA